MKNIGFEMARACVEERAHLMPKQVIPIEESSGFVLAEDIASSVDIPPSAVSAMDGYAIFHGDTSEASKESPARLPISGSSVAGADTILVLPPHTAGRITTGAMIPKNADAVVEEEVVQERDDSTVEIPIVVQSGRNIRRLGADISRNQSLALQGQLLTPRLVGHLAAGGLNEVPVIGKPKIHVIGVGDELVAPGDEIGTAQTYASNLAFIRTWLNQKGIPCFGEIIGDNSIKLRDSMEAALDSSDVLITCGGAWGSSRDLVLPVLEKMGLSLVFQRLLMAPGKGMAFGTIRDKPIFCLPGGPPACEMAFLQLVLPAIYKYAGRTEPVFPHIPARLTEDATCKKKDWTVFKGGTLAEDDTGFTVTPITNVGRMEAMALSNCIIKIPEGTVRLDKDSMTRIQVLSWA